MNEQVSQVPAPIAGMFNIALTQSNFQALADEANALVFNEDNLTKIKDFLDKARKVDKAITATHKTGKEKALEECRNWDKAKNTFLETVAGITEVAQKEYERMCADIENRRRQAEQEKQRIQNIKTGIESNALTFSKQIADCKTTDDLTRVERNINLEKTRKEKYQEFLPELITRLNELNGILANQKVLVKELEENERQQAIAKQQEDANKLIELQQQQATKQAQMEENKTVVQETAINQSINAPQTIVPEEVIPAVKARRTVWSFEVINEKEVMKKSPELVIFTLDKDKVKTMQKTLKDSGQFDGKTELVLNGIRFYEEKTY